MVNKAFARALVKLREQRGLSQEALGLEIGLHRTYISQLERGINSPTLRTIHSLASFFGISLVAFISLVEEELEQLRADSTFSASA
jgi:transcriptional regulator with XRE-family HTH domain